MNQIDRGGGRTIRTWRDTRGATRGARRAVRDSVSNVCGNQG